MPVCCPASTVDALRSQVARGLPAAQVQVGTGEATWCGLAGQNQKCKSWTLLRCTEWLETCQRHHLSPTCLPRRLSWCAWCVTGVQPGPWQSLPVPSVPHSSPLHVSVVGAMLCAVCSCKRCDRCCCLGLNRSVAGQIAAGPVAGLRSVFATALLRDIAQHGNGTSQTLQSLQKYGSNANAVPSES